MGAHRAMWMAMRGPIPSGMCVCHRCDTPRCVKPSHLFLATSQENTADKVAKGRQATGERINSKVTPDQVREIRKLHDLGLSIYDIAPKFGIGKSAVGYIVSRTYWKHIK